MYLRQTVPSRLTPVLFTGAILLTGLAIGPRPAAAQTIEEQLPELFTREDAEVVMTLQDAVQLALDESFDLFRLQERYLQLSYGLETARRSLRTRVNFSSTLPRIQEGFKNYLYTDFAGTISLSPFDEAVRQAAAGVSVVQPLITNGYISLNTRLTAYQRSMQKLPSGSLAELRYVMPRVALEFTQPLFQYNEVRGQLEAATLDLEALQLSYTEVELQRITGISEAFFRLFAAEHLQQIAVESWSQLQLALETTEQKYQLGLVSELEKLGLEVEARNARDRLLQARHELEAEQLAFKRAVGIDVAEAVWVIARDGYVPVRVDADRAMRLALENRSDVRQARIEVEKTELDIRRAVSRGRPDLQFNLAYDVSGNSTIGAPPLGRGDPWGDHLSAGFTGDNSLASTNVSLTLNVPLFDSRTNASRVQRLLSERRVLERETFEAEAELRRQVIERVGEFENARERAGLQAENREAARAGFEISLALFEQGEISYTEMLIAQGRFLETEQLYVAAMIDYEMAKARLREITLHDWETGQPAVQQTTPPEAFGHRREVGGR